MFALLGRLDVRVNDSLWNRLSVEARAEVDHLVGIRRNVQAIAVIRERAGLPRPDFKECVALLDQRFTFLRK
ncbi:hypothetical protein ACFWBF_11165 [Streptomyces sp. NPDC060028]|uniref:hypothetical protein n=1 Tax=Streptomyces sp. NPDC060028 TaxID=3347041 RepID=UPI00369B35C8